MIKKTLYLLMFISVFANMCSCALLQKPIDNRTGFSNYLKEVENSVLTEDWEGAKSSLEESRNTWKKIKPLLQVDIDHDYINKIEESFVQLEGYIGSKEKADSLTALLLVQDTWKNIGSL